jgi:hypothetical protein
VGFLNNGKNIATDDLLNLNTLQNEQEIIDFCNQPHKICKDCVSNAKLSDCFVLWHKKSNLT